MIIELWLQITRTRIDVFAQMIGVKSCTIRAYLYNGSIPGEDIMKKIYNATGRAVDANGFYKLSGKLFEDLVKPPVKEVLHANSFRY